MKHRLAIYASALVLVAASLAPAADKQVMHSLQSTRSPGMVDRVDSLLDVSGTLKVADKAAADAKKSTPLKMNAEATLAYAEKTLQPAASAEKPARAIRHYDKAEASIRVGKDGFKPALRQERSLIGVEIGSSKVVMFCPQGLLTREELDLVDLLGNSLLLDRLLPANPVAVGDTWKHSEELLAALCGLEAVSSSDAQSVLQSVDDGLAQIEMAGYVAGSVNGLSTRMQLKAKYRFDVKAKRITWFALLVKKKREPGPIGPGLDVVARLRMRIVPGAESAELTDAALKGVAMEPTAPLRQLSYASPQGGWRGAHDRRWMLISEKKELTVLRMADEGKYVAQCSVSALSTGEAKPLALADFQEEIRQALGKNFRQFVRASQSLNEAEYQVYRVVAQGEASGVPMEWIYCRLADKLGRSMVILFTVESNMGERLQENDRELVRAIRFADPKVAAYPRTDTEGSLQAK
jgi:hypothetical protein